MMVQRVSYVNITYDLIQAINSTQSDKCDKSNFDKPSLQGAMILAIMKAGKAQATFA